MFQQWLKLWQLEAVQRTRCVYVLTHSNIWEEWVISYHVVYTMTRVEKNNDDAWRNYFSSNLHDPAGKILKAEIRSEYTELYKRVKRQYNKRWWLLAKWWNWGQQKEATNRITWKLRLNFTFSHKSTLRVSLGTRPFAVGGKVWPRAHIRVVPTECNYAW